MLSKIGRFSRKEAGFTLVELMIVVIIVAILAGVAVPLFRANVKKALRTEGTALCGSIRTSERVYKAEHGEYTGTWGNLNIDISDNKYFTTDCVLSDVSTTAFTAKCTGSGDADGLWVQIDQAGAITTD